VELLTVAAVFLRAGFGDTSSASVRRISYAARVRGIVYPDVLCRSADYHFSLGQFSYGRIYTAFWLSVSHRARIATDIVTVFMCD
jgi:hypothetical protein